MKIDIAIIFMLLRIKFHFTFLCLFVFLIYLLAISRMDTASVGWVKPGRVGSAHPTIEF